MPGYLIACTVTLIGAQMFVEADSEEEALRKAKADEWEDVTYETAALMDLAITGKPKRVE